LLPWNSPAGPDPTHKSPADHPRPTHPTAR
jgi:hypothetical protein